MDEQNTGSILCDISFNGQLVADVKLPRACSMGNIVQGLWLDDNFRKTGLAYLKSKDEAQRSEGSEAGAPILQSFRGIDRSILRAYVAIRIMPAWKWLEFKDFIVDFENKKDCYTVGDVLGTLCTGLHKPVLRIVPKSENEADDQEVKNIVNELLKTRSLATLAAAECPLSNGMLSLIAQGKYTSTIGHDKCLAFIRWLRRQDLTNENLTSPMNQTPKQQPSFQAVTSESRKLSKPRITFSQNETDSLLQWFNEDERPSKETMQEYTNILNVPREAASIRLLPFESIAFWFKNRRSKKRRQEASMLEPWEKVEDRSISEVEGGAQQIAMEGGTSQDIGEDGDTPVAMNISTNEAHEMAVANGLASMLVRNASNTPPSQTRKIPKSRVTFDPETELNYLNLWFEDNDRPSKEIVEEYTNILNVARSGKRSRMLTTDSIAMWFKNKRSKKRKGDTNVIGNQVRSEPMEKEIHASDETQAFVSAVVPTTSTEVTTAIVLTTATDLTNVVAMIADETAVANSIPTTAVTTSQIAPDSGSEDPEQNVLASGLIVNTDVVPIQQM